MKNKSFFAALLIFAAAVFLFIACGQIGGSSSDSSTTSDNGSNTGVDTIQLSSLQKVWKVNSVTMDEDTKTFPLTNNEGGVQVTIQLYIYFSPDSKLYFATEAQPQGQGKSFVQTQAPASYTVKDQTISGNIPKEGGGEVVYSSTYTINGDNLNINGPKLSLNAVITDDYKPQQIINASLINNISTVGEPHKRILSFISFPTESNEYGRYTIIGTNYKQEGKFELILSYEGEFIMKLKDTILNDEPNPNMDKGYPINEKKEVTINEETFILPFSSPSQP